MCSVVDLADHVIPAVFETSSFSSEIQMYHDPSVQKIRSRWHVRRQLLIDQTNSPARDPGREGSPWRSGQHVAPVVETTGGWERGADLGHRQTDEHVEESRNQPPVDHRNCTSIGQPGVVQSRHPRQNWDDREGEGKVGEQPAGMESNSQAEDDELAKLGRRTEGDPCQNSRTNSSKTNYQRRTRFGAWGRGENSR